MTQHALRIGQLAKRLGTTTKTLRFYESAGLLAPAGRSESRYRLYDSAAVAKARLVLHLRRLNFSVQELKDLLSPGAERLLRQNLLALMDEKLRDLYLWLGILQGRCDDLSARHQALLLTPRERAPNCICDALFSPCTCVETKAKGKRAQPKTHGH